MNCRIQTFTHAGQNIGNKCPSTDCRGWHGCQEVLPSPRCTTTCPICEGHKIPPENVLTIVGCVVIEIITSESEAMVRVHHQLVKEAWSQLYCSNAIQTICKSCNESAP